MRILQTHVDYIEYEPIRKEIKLADKVEMGKVKIENVLVLFTSVEKGDDVPTGGKAIKEIKEFLDKLKVNKILIYPFAHLSRELAKPRDAIDILNEMGEEAKRLGIETYRAPFGWNKTLEMKVKGHPLAEQSKVFNAGRETEAESKAIKAEEKVVSSWHILEPNGKLTPAKEFNFSKGNENLKRFVDYELEKSRTVHQMPPHITLMKKLEIADNESGSDPGNLRFLPRGKLIKSLLETWVTEKTTSYGAMEVETPLMYDYDHPALRSYLDRFPSRQYIVNSVKKDFFMRFSACFGQFLTMASSNISYKDLPMKVYELAKSFRLEKSGELAGLRRLRSFTMPDMHTLCSDIEMSKKEFYNQFKLCIECMKDIEIDGYETGIRFTEKFWEEDKDFVLSLVKKMKKPVLVEMWNTRFAYFDPKFEFNFIDALGKAAALSTVQLDHENGERFGIKYINKDNSISHPFILHASPSGAIERVIYALLEKAFIDSKNDKPPSLPLWLSPVQVRLVPLSDKFLEDVEKLAGKFDGVRVDIDDRDESVSKKVRNAELDWIPFTVVIGEREVKSGKISLRDRKTGETSTIDLSELVGRIKEETKGKPFKRLNLPMKLTKRPSFGTNG